MTDDRKPGLVALRDRREEVIAILSDAYANDLLADDAFEERIARAHQSTRVATLDELVADLTIREPSLPVAYEPPPLVPDHGVVRAVFSSIERRGAWDVPRALVCRSIFGSQLIDLRETRLPVGITEIHVGAIFGNIEIIVPPHLAVQCEGSAYFASFEHKGSAVADPDRPLLRIVGSAVFGNVEVKVKGDKPRRALPAPSQKLLE